MKSYFQKMVPFGKALSERQRSGMQENAENIRRVEEEVARATEKARQAGISADLVHQRKQYTATERIEKLVNPGTFLPLKSI